MKYVGVDIGGTNLKAGLVDESGTLLATQKMKVASIVDREGLAWTVASLVQELAKAANIPVSDVASVGVGVPGTVDIRAGSIAYTCNLPLRDVPLRKLFHKYLNIPLYIENDANCAALAEFHVGAGRESKRFVTITLGTGVGAGIIHNGKIYHGANGMAGEVGHMVIEQNGLPCPCGRHGCWEQYASASALKRFTAQAQLGNPTQIAAPTTGYFVRAASSGRLNAGAADILAQSPEQLKAYLDSDPEMPLDGCVGKLVAGFSWQYAGVCSAKQAEKLLGADGKPLRTAVEISFPGQSDAALRATVAEVTIDAEQDIARFVLQCNSINGDVLCLNHARARISTGESTGLRVPAAAVHYLKEDGTEAETQGENYIPGVYVKYGNIARFCKIDPVDADHPLISEDDYILVLPKGTDGSVSQVRLYDEIIVSGQNLYDGKLL